ncbi:phosphate ABC transporter substrate-binding protein [Izhakiella australiensis]|uniref:Phosphate ABC transporter substrate-binding protein n=1 Tax=Izhakiella australiensis TaxID=1926881 RepID=A0A1S8YTF3_9GAMM|nr:PhnD/SsuA/transferrin family substrate-binding protein [Izhakiella australiensis]OON42116.1 phosphate ABC transporter substrate-binding protein [Izhakiella australiensis]
MSNLISLPMYDLCRSDSEALCSALRSLLIKRGMPAASLTVARPQAELLSHWRREDLLLSQTCGYPLVTQLAEVQLVGCFHYDAPGCDGARYRSFLVSRQEDAGKALADFVGRRAVCNGLDSQSGYNALRKMVAPLARDGKFFGAVSFSGSHRQSLLALNKNTADIAAIDCVTFALLQRHQPTLLHNLAIIGQSPSAPGLPLITSGATSALTLGMLQDALYQLVSDAAYQQLCRALFITGFSVVTREPYSLLLDWLREAEARGVSAL